MPSWLARLLAPLRRVARRLKEAIRSLLSRRRGGLAALAAAPALRELVESLPAPLRLLVRVVLAVMTSKRGFAFWWLVVTVGLAASIAALVAVLLLPVTALIALIVVGIWMLVRRVRRRRSSPAGNGLRPDRIPDLVAGAA